MISFLCTDEIAGSSFDRSGYIISLFCSINSISLIGSMLDCISVGG